MNPEAEKRRALAGRIARQIKEIATAGIILTGSTAFAPDAVTAESDIDLIAVTQFGRTSFKELYNAIGHPYEPELAEHARKELFDNFTLDWNVEEIAVQLHIWSVEAFVSAVNLEAYQRRFARNKYHKQLNCARPQEVLFNLEGKEKTIERTPIAELPGGRIIPLYICYEDKEGLYLGVPATNLLLEPNVLSQETDYISSGIKYFKSMLSAKISERHGDNLQGLSLCNVLPERIKAKISPGLKDKLDNLLKKPNT